MKLYRKIAWRSLLKNKRRSLATGLAIAAGYAGLCLLGGYILRTERYLRVNSIYINHSGHLSIYKNGGPDFFYSDPKKYQLKGEDLHKLQEVLQNNKKIEFMVPILQGMGLLSNGTKSVPFMGYGINPDDERRIQEHDQVKIWTHELTPPSSEPSIKNAMGPLAETISITRQLGLHLGRPVPFKNLTTEMKDVQIAAQTFDGDLNAVNANLGFQHTTGFAMMEDTSLVAPLQLLRNLYGTEGATYLAVFLTPENSVGEVLQEFEKLFKIKSLNFEVIPFDDDRIGLFYSGTMGFLYIMAGFFVFLIFSAVALSIINSMTIGILERVHEIGTFQALGFTGSQISWLLSLESFYLTLMSLLIGFIMAQGASFLVNGLNIRFTPPGISGDMQFILSPDFSFCLVLCIPILIIGVTCAFIVSRRLVNKPIIQLLQQAN